MTDISVGKVDIATTSEAGANAPSSPFHAVQLAHRTVSKKRGTLHVVQIGVSAPEARRLTPGGSI